MSVEKWLYQYKDALSKRDYAILEKASAILLRNIAPNTSDTLWNPYRAITPSMAPLDGNPDMPSFAGIWNWDSAFHAIGVARFDKNLAQEQVEAFFLFQKENGMLPDVIHMPVQQNKIEDKIGKPPVWAWALELLDRRAPDDDFIKKMYPRLCLNEDFWRKERYNECDGLYFYSSTEMGEWRDKYIRWESGLDDSIRFDGGVIEYLYPVDLNCFMVSFYKSMQYLAMRLDLFADAEKWCARAKELSEKILTALWSEEDACFFDFNFKERDFVRVITPAIYMPLWVNIATPEQARAVHRFAVDDKKLYPCMPTVALDHPKMDPEGYWRGSVWMNVAYFAIKGLYDYGYKDTALDIRNTLLDWIANDDTIHENYNPLTGVGKCKADFSWSCVFAIEMILEMK